MPPERLDERRVSVSAINALHNRCVTRFREHFRTEIEIAPHPTMRSRWERRDLQKEVVFFLWPKRGPYQWARRPVANTPYPVVSAGQRSDAWGSDYFIWVGWRELWARRGQDDFEFEEAGFTFCCGHESTEPLENQLFRAEWPQGSLASKRAGQPHWQLDWPLANLSEFVSGIHFGMAGWECAPNSAENDHVSVHWRRDVGAGTGDLEKWAVRTLEYSLDQIALFYKPELA